MPSPATRLAVAGHLDQCVNGGLERGANGIGSESGCPDICLSVKKTDELRPSRDFSPFYACLSGQPSGTSTENRPFFMKAGVRGMIPVENKVVSYRPSSPMYNYARYILSRKEFSGILFPLKWH